MKKETRSIGSRTYGKNYSSRISKIINTMDGFPEVAIVNIADAIRNSFLMDVRVKEDKLEIPVEVYNRKVSLLLFKVKEEIIRQIKMDALNSQMDW